MEAGPGELLPPPSVNCTIWRPCARVSSRKRGKHYVQCAAFTGFSVESLNVAAVVKTFFLNKSLHIIREHKS